MKNAIVVFVSERTEMEMFLKIAVLFVIISYVFAEHQHEEHSSSTQKPDNSTDSKKERAEVISKYLVDCTEETKVKPDMILNLRSGKWRQALRKEPPALKRWSLCVLVKSGMMSPDGVLKQDAVLASVPSKDRVKVERVIDKCLYKKKHAPIDIAWHYVACFHSRYPKYSII